MLKLDAEIEKSSLKEVTLQNNETLLAVGFWTPALPKTDLLLFNGISQEVR